MDNTLLFYLLKQIKTYNMRNLSLLALGTLFGIFILAVIFIPREEYDKQVVLTYDNTSMYEEGLIIIFHKPKGDRIIPTSLNGVTNEMQYSELLDMLKNSIPNTVLYDNKFYGTINYTIEEWEDFIYYNLKIQNNDTI